MSRVAILQSNYIPWRGYFDLVAKVDEFVIYDSCQYTVNDWRNRNQLKTRQGLTWLTIPVLTKGRTGQLIDEAEFDGFGWASKHRKSIEQAMGKAPHYDTVAPILEAALGTAPPTNRLHDVNVALIGSIATALGLSTRITIDRSYGDLEGDASERVAELAARAGATSYVTGPRGLDYPDATPFATRGIALEVVDYSTLGPYPQLFDGFESAVTVLDLLANCGPDAASHLTSTLRTVTSIDGELSIGDPVASGSEA